MHEAALHSIPMRPWGRVTACGASAQDLGHLPSSSLGHLCWGVHATQARCRVAHMLPWEIFHVFCTGDPVPCLQGWIDKSLRDRVLQLLQRARLPVTVPDNMTVDMFKSLMAVDKKVGRAACTEFVMVHAVA